jgi:hypothetical protein
MNATNGAKKITPNDADGCGAFPECLRRWKKPPRLPQHEVLQFFGFLEATSLFPSIGFVMTHLKNVNYVSGSSLTGGLRICP